MQLMKWNAAKPDYMRIQAKTGKEMPIVVRRIIQHEKLKLQTVHHLEGKKTYDVVLLTADRLIIVRHFYGTTKAFFQEFHRDRWEQYTDPQYPNLIKFLSRYHDEVQPLADEWMIIKDVSARADEALEPNGR